MGGTYLSADQLAELAQIDSPTIANAVDSFKVRDPAGGYAGLQLRCMYPELPPAVGYAITCTDDSSTPRREPGAGYEALYEAMARAPKPVMLVFKGIGDPSRSLHMGEVMGAMVHALGAVAVITDGGVRDLAGVRMSVPGLQMFAAGAVVAGGAPSLGDIGVTVSIFGLTIKPGDLLHGDANGVLSIPSSIADRVAARAREIGDRERRLVEFIRSPGFSLENYNKHRASIGADH